MAGRRAIVLVAGCLIATQPQAAEPQFRFQNNFWVNLHHLLRGDARRRPLNLPPAMKLAQLTDAERAAWTSSLDAYADVGRRDLLFDAGLVRINSALAQVVSEDTLTAPSLDPAIVVALNRAAPVYRAHGWARQKKINDDWIAALRPLMDRHASSMAAALAKVYRVEWPDRPIIVDACTEAGPNGGYTTGGPPGTAAHTVIEAGNRGYQGEMAFEMVFHEASHADAIGARIVAMIDEAGRKQQVTPHKDLWHVLIFYTAGEMARRELGHVGDSHYMPYAYRYDVYEPRWQKLRDAVVSDWQPYLDGTVELDAALAKLVRDARQ